MYLHNNCFCSKNTIYELCYKCQFFAKNIHKIITLTLGYLDCFGCSNNVTFIFPSLVLKVLFFKSSLSLRHKLNKTQASMSLLLIYRKLQGDYSSHFLFINRFVIYQLSIILLHPLFVYVTCKLFRIRNTLFPLWLDYICLRYPLPQHPVKALLTLSQNLIFLQICWSWYVTDNKCQEIIYQ
jgi:hypothetical protein